MYKAIIFDFFDVIRTDPLNSWIKKYNYQKDAKFKAINQRLDLGQLDTEEFQHRLSQLSGQHIETIINEYNGTVETHSEVVSLLFKLGKNYQLGLLSNAPSGYLRNLLNKHSYTGLFHEIVISSEAGLIKPSREAFEHILAKLEAEPSEAIFIDDKPENVAAAKKLGITGIVFTDLEKLKIDLTKAGVKI